MLKRTLFLLAVIFALTTGYSAAQSPLVTGTVKISIDEGTFDCDFTLSEMPRIDDYLIRINSGMNILNFRSVAPYDFVINSRMAYDPFSGEAKAYYFADNTGKGKFMPEKLRIRYVGKYPVAADTLDRYTAFDWKGNLAFNGYSLRADGEQSAWYPILYDVALNKQYAEVRYDIEVICEGAEVLYINGHTPFYGDRSRFQSDDPRQIAIFLGRYDVQNLGDTYFLNSGLNDEQLDEFGGFTNVFKKYYAEKLSIPYGQEVIYVNTTPTSKYNSWQFVSYPSIFCIDHKGLQNYFKPENFRWFKRFIAHELAHYYFGTLRKFNSELGDMLSEGLSEYASMQVTRDLIGEEEYKGLISRKMGYLEGFEATPFSKVKTQSDYKDRQLYSYNYGPMLFDAIGKEIGTKKMWKWMNAMLTTPADFTNYEFIEKTLAGVATKKEVETIKKKYFESDNSLENIKTALEL